MRNLCCKCPHYYNEQSWEGDYDWGCRIFGMECERCPSFWDDEGDADETEMGCNVHPKKMAYLINQENKRFIAWNKRDYKENKLVKHYSILPKEERGYKAYRNDGTWMGFWTDDYRPNMKGGHRHNHIRNAHKRMRKCHFCEEPIVNGCEVIGYSFHEFKCRSCKTEEYNELASLVAGVSFDNWHFKIRRRKK